MPTIDIILTAGALALALAGVALDIAGRRARRNSNNCRAANHLQNVMARRGL